MTGSNGSSCFTSSNPRTGCWPPAHRGRGFSDLIGAGGQCRRLDAKPGAQAIVFLYKQVLKKPVKGRIDAARSAKEPRVPVGLTRDEVAKVLPLIDGTAGLVVKLL